MDFSFTESQDAVRQLAEQVFTGTATVERVREVEASEDMEAGRVKVSDSPEEFLQSLED